MRIQTCFTYYLEYHVFFIFEKGKSISLPESFQMNQRTYLFEVVYVSYVRNVPLGTINLSASYDLVRFCSSKSCMYDYGY